MNMRIIPIYGEGVVCQFASVYDATKRKTRSGYFSLTKKECSIYFYNTIDTLYSYVCHRQQQQQQLYCCLSSELLFLSKVSNKRLCRRSDGQSIMSHQWSPRVAKGLQGSSTSLYYIYLSLGFGNRDNFNWNPLSSCKYLEGSNPRSVNPSPFLLANTPDGGIE